MLNYGLNCLFYISRYHPPSILFPRTHFKNCGYWLGNQNTFISALHSSDLSWRFLLTSNLNCIWLGQCENSLPEVQQRKKKVLFFSRKKDCLSLFWSLHFFSVSQSMCYLEIIRMLFCNTPMPTHHRIVSMVIPVPHTWP